MQLGGAGGRHRAADRARDRLFACSQKRVSVDKTFPCQLGERDPKISFRHSVAFRDRSEKVGSHGGGRQAQNLQGTVAFGGQPGELLGQECVYRNPGRPCTW
jgi:hypothetical protein